MLIASNCEESLQRYAIANTKQFISFQFQPDFLAQVYKIYSIVLKQAVNIV